MTADSADFIREALSAFPTLDISRIPQWESDAVSEGQTLRNEDNAFLPLSSGQISLLCEFCQSHKALCQAAEKTLKQHTWVSSPLQVRPSLMFNCGIRDERIDRWVTPAV